MNFATVVGVLLLSSLTLGQAALDIRRLPTPAEREAIAADLSAAKESLETALVASYLPGGMGRSGTTGNAAYRSWLTLWKWADLLSRSSEEDALALFGRHLYFQSPDADKPTFIGPGFTVPEEMIPLPPEVLSTFTSSNIRDELFRMLVPEPIPLPSATPLAQDLDPAFLKALTLQPRWLDLFFSTLSDEDYAPGVLWNLEHIWKANPAKFDQYFGLALALSVVYDQQRPKNWPHHQVKSDLVPIVDRPVSEWFDFWIASNESRSLLFDLKQLSPSELKFIIDAPLNPEEFEWARKNVKFPRTTFDRAFSSVPYTTARIRGQEFVWNDVPYLLGSIRQRGGICVDQAYYAMIAGKARGLPTLFFTGQGADGGHAWFGYMKAPDRWDMDCGRYENQNYAVGEALDPQNWRPISDHELKALAEKYRSKPDFAASQDDVLIGKLFEKRGEKERASRAYDSAVAVSQRNPEAWQAKGDFLARSEAANSARQNFHQAALRQFETQRDIRLHHQLALAGLLRDAGDVKAAETLENQIMSQNKTRRVDLSVQTATQRLRTLMAEKKTDEALREYRRLLVSLKRTGGGAFFYDVSLPFAEALAQEGDYSRAKDVLVAAQKALQPETGSILDQDLRRAIGKLDP